VAFAAPTAAVIVALSLGRALDGGSGSAVLQTSDPPSTDSRTTETSECPTGDNAATTVDVKNVTGTNDGLAHRVLDELANNGFERGTATDAHEPPSSVVRYATGQEAAGCRVAEALDRLPVEPDSNLPAGKVSVFLNTDYHGPGALPEPTT